ncbi:hypothetical protein JCM10212_003197 [Sporobolomyces blumeae]
MHLCVACSATLDSTASLPTSSEKPASPVSFPCGHSVCARCTSARRSLATACVLCQSAHDLLSSSSSASRPSRPPHATLPSYTGHLDDDEFVLGDDSDDDATDGPDRNEKQSSPPPGIEDRLIHPDDEPPAYDDDNDGNTTATKAHVDSKDQERSTERCNLHYLKPEETLAGLALKYRVEGPLLCSMNRLPISTLSTTPHLVHTLPFVLLPPGAAPSTSTEPILAPREERRRLIIRRFQLQAKCADYSVAKAYCEQVWKKREEEADFVRTNRVARRTSGTTDETPDDHALRGERDEVEVREGGELEEAVEAYLADERWEREQKENANHKGKGTLFGSKLRTTGQVEAKVKSGWRWI